MIHLIMFLFVNAFIAACVSTPRSEESWHLLPVNNDLALISSPAQEDGKRIGGAVYISILCKYGVTSISNECITSFNFMRYPDNYAVFSKNMEPSKLKVGFRKEGVDGHRYIDFYSIKDGILMVSPNQVNDFLSILSSSDKVSFHLSWRVMRATYDETYNSIFTFKLKKTTLAISRFKNLVITKSQQKLQKPQRPKEPKKISDIISNYI